MAEKDEKKELTDEEKAKINSQDQNDVEDVKEVEDLG